MDRVRLPIPHTVSPEGLEEDLRRHGLQEAQGDISGIVTYVNKDIHFTCFFRIYKPPTQEMSADVTGEVLKRKATDSLVTSQCGEKLVSYAFCSTGTDLATSSDASWPVGPNIPEVIVVF